MIFALSVAECFFSTNDMNEQRSKAILLLGPTGAGKTPLGEVIERNGLQGRRCSHFDFGESLRRVVASGPSDVFSQEEVGFLQSVLGSGALLEDDHFPIAEKILRGFIATREIGPDDRIVLNGLPRHAGQADDVDAIVDVRLVVDLSCPPDAVFERIRTDAGGDRAARADDDVAAVRNRLEIYTKRIAPLVEHYYNLGARVETVDVAADTTPQQAWEVLSAREPLES